MLMKQEVGDIIVLVNKSDKLTSLTYGKKYQITSKSVNHFSIVGDDNTTKTFIHDRLKPNSEYHMFDSVQDYKVRQLKSILE